MVQAKITFFIMIPNLSNCNKNAFIFDIPTSIAISNLIIFDIYLKVICPSDTKFGTP